VQPDARRGARIGQQQQREQAVGLAVLGRVGGREPQQEPREPDRLARE